MEPNQCLLVSRSTQFDNINWHNDSRMVVFQDSWASSGHYTILESWFNDGTWFAYDLSTETLAKNRQNMLVEHYTAYELEDAGVPLTANNPVSPSNTYMIYAHSSEEWQPFSMMNRETGEVYTIPDAPHELSRSHYRAWWSDDETTFLLKSIWGSEWDGEVRYYYGYNYADSVQNLILHEIAIPWKREIDSSMGREVRFREGYDISPDGTTVLMKVFIENEGWTLAFYNPLHPLESEIVNHDLIDLSRAWQMEFYAGDNERVAYINESGINIYDHNQQLNTLINADFNYDISDLGFSPNGRYVVIDVHGQVYLVDLTENLAHHQIKHK